MLLVAQPAVQPLVHPRALVENEAAVAVDGAEELLRLRHALEADEEAALVVGEEDDLAAPEAAALVLLLEPLCARGREDVLPARVDLEHVPEQLAEPRAEAELLAVRDARRVDQLRQLRRVAHGRRSTGRQREAQLAGPDLYGPVAAEFYGRRFDAGLRGAADNRALLLVQRRPWAGNGPVRQREEPLNLLEVEQRVRDAAHVAGAVARLDTVVAVAVTRVCHGLRGHERRSRAAAQPDHYVNLRLALAYE